MTHSLYGPDGLPFICRGSGKNYWESSPWQDRKLNVPHSINTF